MLASVVMPALNEEKNIEEAVNEVKDVLSKAGIDSEIIVVDDGSTDNTFALAEKTGAKVFKHDKNMGKGAATRTAISKSTGDVVVIQDCDLTIPASTIPKLIELLDQYDAAYASRMAGKAEKGAMPFYRVFGNKFFAATLSITTGQKLSDTLSGQKAFKREVFDKVKIETNSWPDFEILIKSAKNGFKTCEYPAPYYKRRDGKSKMKILSHGFWLFSEIIRWHLS